MSNDPQITQRQLPRKHALMLALVFQPGRDYALFGDQILMDLSHDETVLADRILATFGPALEALDEAQLMELVKARAILLGDLMTQLFGGT